MPRRFEGRRSAAGVSSHASTPEPTRKTAAITTPIIPRGTIVIDDSGTPIAHARPRRVRPRTA